ncbi:MAG: Omp28-related outer membrane protein [Bacteroidales bacterium]|nr:Omp28-related outer membrane protein [Bacteroidales bacterium]
MDLVGRVIVVLAWIAFFSCTSEEKEVVNPDGGGGGGGIDTIMADVKVSKKVLIEDYVATWCGNCILAIEKSEQADPSVFIPVAIHFLGSAIENDNAIRVARENGITSQTTVITDKHTSFNFRKGFNAADFQNKTVVAIAINSEQRGTAVDFTIQFKFYADLSNLRYSAYLLRNGIIAVQRNYQFSGSIYEDSPRTILNFTHNHVLQDIILNQSIADAQSVKDNTFDQTHSFNIGTGNIQDFEIVVYVEDQSRVFNTQRVHAGQSVNFHEEVE